MPSGVYKRRKGWVSPSSFKKGSIPWNKGIKGILAGKESPNWKGGKPKCIDCGKILSLYHYTRCMKCNSKHNMGSNHPNWIGGKHIRKDGYIMVYSPYHPYKGKRQYVFEHRLKMEKHLKRFLTPEEVVHHINENPSDNRIKNLMVLTRAEHQRIHHTKKEK